MVPRRAISTHVETSRRGGRKGLVTASARPSAGDSVRGGKEMVEGLEGLSLHVTHGSETRGGEEFFRHSHS
jgi:hypothetical protein